MTELTKREEYLRQLEDKRKQYVDALKEIPRRLEEAQKEEQRVREASMLGYQDYPRFTRKQVEERRDELQLRLETCLRWISEAKAEVALDHLEQRIRDMQAKSAAMRVQLADQPSAKVALDYEANERILKAAMAELEAKRPNSLLINVLGWWNERQENTDPRIGYR